MDKDYIMLTKQIFVAEILTENFAELLYNIHEE